jgi:hypothetical protein
MGLYYYRGQMKRKKEGKWHTNTVIIALLNERSEMVNIL